MMDMILDAVPADGDLVRFFSSDKAVDNIIKKGQTFFARNDLHRALEAYLAAESLDPMLYEAPLFIGDCYFMLKRIDDDGRAYARAIAIDPIRETAYRYWGHGLMQAGRMEEARAKLIEKNGMNNWLSLYDPMRILWRNEIFAQQYPGEKQYRHSLPEEADGPIRFLQLLEVEGLLEAYILLALADDGISQDYPSYRAQNREAIRQYLERYVIHNK